jgi:hypothetical protein
MTSDWDLDFSDLVGPGTFNDLSGSGLPTTPAAGLPPDGAGATTALPPGGDPGAPVGDATTAATVPGFGGGDVATTAATVPGVGGSGFDTTPATTGATQPDRENPDGDLSTKDQLRNEFNSLDENEKMEAAAVFGLVIGILVGCLLLCYCQRLCRRCCGRKRNAKEKGHLAMAEYTDEENELDLEDRML